MPSISSPLTASQLSRACKFFNALASNASSPVLLSHFSTSQEVTVQHYPAACPNPRSSLLRGPNAIRSYFDLLATHWTRSNLVQHSIVSDPDARTVVTNASVTWKWRKSGHQWTEDFLCTLTFDDALQIVSLTVRTDSGPTTCVMRAVDPLLKTVVERPWIPVAVRPIGGVFLSAVPQISDTPSIHRRLVPTKTGCRIQQRTRARPPLAHDLSSHFHLAILRFGPCTTFTLALPDHPHHLS